ncbi:PQQ-binding-like beta-propeller repeat protein [Streptomyces sp. SID8366]|uniref:serine/threonine-protein kinase n=3 Tax=Streptomyces TaxID=1883 RepID=UPI000DB9E0EB|nr:MULTISPECIES: serine/threonine-protein kinase [unclassified Streptomyces]MYU05540.1 PQQ-binding-like beta-propeller repeat protein [Streptomyces sp. SID8366]
MTPQRSTGTGAEADMPEYAGHYHLESRLGSGGMGVVHLARSTSGLRLAVKVVHAEFARDREFRGRFRQEVAAARRVSGAFTAPVVDADPEAARPWMATLYIPGPTLSEQVKEHGPLDAGQLRRLMAGLAEALRDIHRVGVVHRDLKPSNVLLAEDGPKVIDFGISRPKDSELRTETGKLIGTPPFMAPEQFRRPREVGPAADIFALGSVLVHAATGRGPFDSDSPYVVAYQVVHDEPDLSGVPAGLAPLIERCLAKDPDERPTPDELMRQLRSVAASYDTQAFIPAQRKAGSADGPAVKAPEHPRPAPSKRRVRPGRVAAVAAGVLALAVGGALAWVQWPGADAPAAGAPRTAAVGFAGWRTTPVAGQSDAPRCAFGAGRLLCAGAGQAYALDPRGGRVLWRHPFTGARWSAAPAVSGGLVQVRDEAGDVVALDPDTGRTHWRRTLPTGAGTQYADGTLLVTAADGTVTGVDSASGRTRWSHRLPGTGRPGVDSYPGGGAAYASTASADGRSTRVVAFDPRTGAVRWDTRLTGLLRPVGAADGTVFFVSADPVYGDTDAVVRYDAATRAVRRVPLPAPRPDVHAVVREGVVYLLDVNGGLDAVDTAAGKRLWHLETSVSRGSALVAGDRYLYFSAGDGRLLAVDARGGRLAGQTPARPGDGTARIAALRAAPVLAAPQVFATAPDGSVSALDGRDPSAW